MFQHIERRLMQLLATLSLPNVKCFHMRLWTVIGILVLLSAGMLSPAHAVLVGKWADSHMSYRTDSGCAVMAHDYLEGNDYLRSDAIHSALSAWQTWFPEITWTDSVGSPEVTFVCLEEATIPNAGAVIGAAVCYSDDAFDAATNMWTYSRCDVKMAGGAFVVRQSATNIAAHEIGHVLGLLDRTGGLMDLTGPMDGEFGVVLPTADQVSELCAQYNLPARDLSSRTEVVTTNTTTSEPPVISEVGQTVTVWVTVDGRWIVGADVTLSSVGTKQTTGDPAAATFINVAPGTYVVTASKLGYHEYSSTITITTAPIGLLAPLIPIATMATAPYDSSLLSHWPTRTITYAYSGLYPMPVEFKPIVEAAITNWHQWLPELNFTESTFGQEDITFEFYQALTVPSGNYAESVTETNGNVFTHATVRTAVYTFTSRHDLQGGVNALDHELGHILGLDDWTGGIMGGDSSWDTLSDSASIIAPTETQLAQLHATYAVVPIPEFSSMLFVLVAPCLTLVIACRYKRRGP